MESKFVIFEAAQAWLRRVEAWHGHITGDLRADSVPAPAGHGVCWILFAAATATLPSGAFRAC
eukprot:4626345-Lingulodinium_polyedra.AAC.1